MIMLGDLDTDGYPELIQTGPTGLTIFKNVNGSFQAPISYPQFIGEAQYLFHTLDLGDIDRDGLLDILQSGGPNYRVFRILLNKNEGLVDIGSSYMNGLAGASFLGDMEGDGDLDILFSGVDEWSNMVGGILENRNGQFIRGPYLAQHMPKFATWCDLDHDSRLEIFQSTGSWSTFTANYLLEATYPSTTIIETLSAINNQADHVSFADYDADGDLDMLASIFPARIFKNENGHFVNTGIVFPEARTAEFADVNNDGRYDVIIGGMMTPTWWVFETGVYLNQVNGTFTKLSTNIPSQERGGATFGDIDGDGDIDIPTLDGVYKNTTAGINLKPSAPLVKDNSVSGSSVTLSWEAADDDTTPVNSLTYNISVWNEEGDVIVPAHALSSGRRQVFRMGNAYNKLSFQLSCLQEGTYFWKVQALDASFQGSEFSPEHSFTVTQPSPAAPTSLSALAISDTQVKLTWTDASATEDGFIIFLKYSGENNNFYPIDTVAADGTSYLVSGLEPGTSYDYRIVASNCAYPEEFWSETQATTFPPAFVESSWLNLDETAGNMVMLGDYDNDHDLDLLISYDISDNTKLFRFDGPEIGYVDSGVIFPFKATHAVWLDFNNDGFLDLYFNNNTLYKNTAAGSFTAETTSHGIPNISSWQGGVSWGDYDQDGDQDLLVPFAIYSNDGDHYFSASGINLGSSHTKSFNAWADYDRDGDLDIIASKEISCSQYVLTILENQGSNSFIEVQFANLGGLNKDFWNETGDMEWGDYDNDGYPDLIVSGQTTCGNGFGITQIYHNNGNKTFTLSAILQGLINDVNVDWGDYDNDGDLDVFMYGDPFVLGPKRTYIYRNDGNGFSLTNIDYMIESLQHGKAARGDIDNDGDLDYVIAGEIDYVNPRIFVYKNQYAEGWSRPNHKPSAPTSPESEVNDQSVTLSWSMSTDEETQSMGLTYNLRIIDEWDTVRVNAFALSDGTRLLVGQGNIVLTSHVINNLKPGTYSWAVQAIDNSFSGSEFSEAGTFTVESITAVEDELEELKVYPNPTQHTLTIEIPHDVNADLIISNALGQPLSRTSVNTKEVTLNISALPSGVYFLILKTLSGKSSVHKFVKQ